MSSFGVISDQHFHDWSAFSSSTPTGVSSRLQTQLDELRRCASEVRASGGNLIVNAGDTFHVRGKLAPSVLNPVLDLHRELIRDGFQFLILAGNHDLERREADRLGSAVTALEGVGCTIVNHATVIGDKAFVPWIQHVADLKVAIQNVAPAQDRPGLDLIIHAPIDGVIPGLPDHGLSAEWLGDLGFRRVFSGHYHSHVAFPKEVYSVGASTHQTWSDVGSKAGFLIVSDSGVRHFATHAPNFVEVDGSTDPAEIPLIVDGHYVKCRIRASKQSDIEALRQYLLESGAKGVVIVPQPDTTAAPTRTGSAVVSTSSLEQSVTDYVKASSYDRPDDLSALCASIMAQARAVSGDAK